ncbi:hypothetical protein [Picrophilus oshimae]|uniref:DNA replication factor GINS n=1 Tax=Picrophilus torridus (strain ATCC 700027 / DSM 9790 / JCM 10055 / NBRC 100828 / KAW 2/3) TaxID=1122961 RepID=A0A8G2FY23_PICTO|nr:hypothetical protein [Picrophilus oshimae]SMD31612.1 DNA replication factor GINS [Picrophilus oshimae DSM 9789]
MDREKYDEIIENLKAQILSERNSSRINKIDSNFYSEIRSIKMQLQEEQKKNMQDITLYMDITGLYDELKKLFHSFYELRFSKIAKFAVYDIQDDIYNLTPEEKTFYENLKREMNIYFKEIFDGEKPKEEEKVEEKIEVNEVNNIEGDAEIGSEAIDNEYIILRITENQPPIAQPERNYYLHKNDVVYLRKGLADILIKRNAAVKINI